MEDFVSFEIAKKLKEKGFKEKCLTYYDVEDNVGLLYNTQYTDEVIPCQYTDLLQCHNTGKAEPQIDDSNFCIDAPTISQVLKWLRDEKKIHITILVITDCSKDADNNICEEWSFWSFYVTNLNDGSTVYDDFEKIDCIEYQSYEEAAFDGIKYVLDNLI